MPAEVCFLSPNFIQKIEKGYEWILKNGITDRRAELNSQDLPAELEF